MKKEEKMSKLDIILTSEVRLEIEGEIKELKDEISFLNKSINHIFIITLLCLLLLNFMKYDNTMVFVLISFIILYVTIRKRIRIFKNNLYGLEHIDKEIESFIDYYNESEELSEELSQKDVPDTIEAKKYFYFHKIFK
jgi:uncharacterized membrane protein